MSISIVAVLLISIFLVYLPLYYSIPLFIPVILFGLWRIRNDQVSTEWRGIVLFLCLYTSSLAYFMLLVFLMIHYFIIMQALIYMIIPLI